MIYNPRLVAPLLECGADVEATDDEGCTPLLTAAAHDECVEALVLAGADLAARDSDGRAPEELCGKPWRELLPRTVKLA